MKRRRDKRSERFAERNRAATEERLAAAEQRRAAEELRAAAALAPPLPGGPAVPAIAAPQRVVPEKVYKSLLGKPNPNHMAPDKVKGRQWLPLPKNAPSYEVTFFELKKEDKTGNDLVDAILQEIYDECFNDIGDKRREVLQFLSSSKQDDREDQRLSDQLDGLMYKTHAKMTKLVESTGHLINFPDYFLKYPALKE